MEMVRFAHLNPEHIILLLTKNPAWYGLVEWPENVWCGFTATNNDELISRYRDTVRAGCLPRIWGSYEPWLDDMMPHATGFEMPQWTVIGGQSRPDRPVSEATLEWLRQPMDAKRFVKRNAFNAIDQKWDKLTTVAGYPREYPAEWGVESCSGQ